MQGHYVRGLWRHGGGDRSPVYFIPDVKIFFFIGCDAEKLMHFCPPVYSDTHAIFYEDWSGTSSNRTGPPKLVGSCHRHQPGSAILVLPLRLDRSDLLKFFVYFLCIFNTLWCILLLSLCFGSACPPLTLLQLRYILWCFIVYFRIISRDLTCAFQSGVQDFTVVYASLMHHSWS